MNLLDLVARLSFEDTNFEQGVSNVEKRVTTMGGVISKVVMAGGILKLGKDALKTGMDFDSAMSQVAATLGLSQEEINRTGGEFEQLRNKALEMGSSTKFTSTESAEALNYLAMAGLSTQESIAMLPKVLTAAGASGMDLALTADKLTNIMSALGLTSDDATTLMSNTGRVIDVLAETSTKANTDVYGLFESLSTVGSTAKIMQDPVKELSIATGILADNDMQASEAGTHLRNIIMSLGTPTKEGSALLEKLGVSAWDSQGKFRPLQDTLLDLNDSLSGMSQEEKMNIIGKIFNLTDISSVNALLDNCSTRWDELSLSIDGAEGAAQRMYDTQQNNLKGSFESLGSALEGLRIAFSDILTPAVSLVVDKLIWFVEELRKVVAGSEDANFGIELLVAGIIGLVTSFTLLKGIGIVVSIVSFTKTLGSALIMVKSFKGAWTLLSVAFGTTPLGLVITLIAGLVAGVVYLWNTSDNFRNFWINIWEVIKNKFSECCKVIVNFFTVTIPDAFNTFISFLQQLPGKVWNFLLQVIQKVIQWRIDMISKAIEVGINFVNSIVTFFQELPGKIRNFLVQVVQRTVQWKNDMINKAKETGINFINSIITFFQQLPGKIWNFLVQVVLKIIQWRIDMINKAIEIGVNFINSIVTFFQQLPGKIWSQLTAVIQKVIQWKNDMINKAKEIAALFLNNLVDGLKSIPGKMVSIGKNIVEGVWNGIKSMASTFTNNVKNFFGGIVDSAKAALGIHSPSREMRDEVGKWIPAGVGVGIEDEMPALKQKFEEGMSDLTNVKFTPKVDTIAQLSNSISNMVQRNIEVVFNVDGREFNRQVVAPYQDEIKRYNNIRRTY